MMIAEQKIKGPPARRIPVRAAEFRMSEKRMEEYLEKMEQSGCAAVTLQSYRRSLRQLYLFLPEDKCIREGILTSWQETLREAGYSVSTINSCTAAANGMMMFYGYTKLQAERLPETEENIQPELTRAEYLRLLSTARRLGRERHYLLVKVFGSAGLSVGEMESLTAEAVREGKILLPTETLRIPEGLKKELLHFMKEEQIVTGPVFLTRNGTPQDRTAITKMLKTLCRDARVAEEKATPRCLRKLYVSTQAGIFENLSLLAEQAYDRLLEKEQQSIGWEQDIG